MADVPMGVDIAAGLVTILAAVLIIAAKKIVSTTSGDRHAVAVPSDPVADVRPLFERLEVSDSQIRAEISGVTRMIAERLDQIDRQSAQRLGSLGDGLTRAFREKELEDRRQFEHMLGQFERVLDKLDRIKLPGSN